MTSMAIAPLAHRETSRMTAGTGHAEWIGPDGVLEGKAVMKRFIARLFAGGVAIALILVALRGCSSEWDEPRDDPEITVEKVIADLRSIAELSTAEVSVSGIVRASRSRWWLPGRERMVVIVRGVGRYAIDLERAVVSARGQRIRIELPQPMLSTAWVDLDRSEIWEHRHTGWFGRTSPAVAERTWRAAGELVEEGADTETHRQLARTHAERELTRLIRGALPDAIVEVRWMQGMPG